MNIDELVATLKPGEYLSVYYPTATEARRACIFVVDHPSDHSSRTCAIGYGPTLEAAADHTAVELAKFRVAGEAVWAGARKDAVYEWPVQVQSTDQAIQELAETRMAFDLRWNADMRAIKRWQADHPGNDLTWPDHADMVVWALERLDATQAEVRRLWALLGMEYPNPVLNSPPPPAQGITETSG